MPKHLEKFYNRIDSIRERNPLLADALQAHGYRSIRQMCIENNLDVTHTNDLLNGKYPVFCKDGYACCGAREVEEILGVFPEQLQSKFTFERWSRKRDRRIEYEHVTPQDAWTHARCVLNRAAQCILTRNEKIVLGYRYGFRGDRPWGYTYGDVGEILNCSKERIRQIESKALRKLKGLHLRTGCFNECGEYIPQRKRYVAPRVDPVVEPPKVEAPKRRKRGPYKKRTTPTIWQQMKREQKAEQQAVYVKISTPQPKIPKMIPVGTCNQHAEPTVSVRGIENRLRPQDPRVMRVHTEFLRFQAEHSARMAAIERIVDQRLFEMGVRDRMFREHLLKELSDRVADQMAREILA